MSSAQETGPRVLLVDDDARVRTTLKALLKRSGIDVVGEAADGADGVAQAWMLKPDVIVMDYNMPDMNGIEATEALSETLPKTVVLFYSGHNQELLKTDAKLAGAYDFIAKGSSAAEIADRIALIWSRRSQ